MTRTIEVAPVRKSVRVNADQARAFDAFTAGLDKWWPRTHTVGGSPLKKAILEPFEGGRWFHIGEDGSESDNGRVLVFDPPKRLLLTWEINSDWKCDPTAVSEIEVTFFAEGPNETRVELEHRHLDRLGPKSPEVRIQIDGPGGWGSILEAFKSVAESND
jgi:uncharacterized protein YndB with AHSA1/START domain